MKGLRKMHEQIQQPSAVRRLLQPAPEDAFGELFAVLWHGVTTGMMDNTNPKVITNFYNSANLAPADEIAVPIIWSGFPRRARVAVGLEEAIRTKDDPQPIFPGSDIKLRTQDEYLEWRVERNARTNRISRIVFTCESEDYWEALASCAPDRLVELYRKFVSPDVQHADLYRPTTTNAPEDYYPYNKWNRTHGIMHLHSGNNTLRAAIELVAAATVLRPPISVGAPALSEAARIACIAGATDPNRSADLQLNGIVNRLVQAGARISLAIPAAIFIAHYDSRCVTDGKGVPVPDFWRVLRGSPGVAGDPARPSRILSLEYSVPEEYGCDVGDLYVDGQPIEYGGQLARHIRMQLIVTASFANATRTAPRSSTDVADRSIINHDVLQARRVTTPHEPGYEEGFPLDQQPAVRPNEPLLDLDDIQGNVVVGFNTPHQAIVGVWFRAVAAARAWLLELAPLITSSADAYQVRAAVREARAERREKPISRDAYVNVTFSAPGLRQLGVATHTMSNAFVEGQWRRAPGILGDPVDEGPGALKDWVVGGSSVSTPDALVICAAESAELRDRARDELIALARRHSHEVRYVEDGDDLRGAGGVTGLEHFGFKDNIAKVRLRGMYPAGTYYNADAGNIPQAPELPQFSAPGEPLVWPGQIVLGYPRQSTVDTRESMPADARMPDWMRNGSYLVFRRLRQNVPLFRRFSANAARTLQRSVGAGAPDQSRVAAMMVGRWPDGTPLMLAPSAQPAQANATNDFVYGRVNWPPGSDSPADPLGDRCPAAAHIRKVNPRDQSSDLGPSAETLRRAIQRRGIPYGRPLPADSTDDIDRGLLFLSYQASIEETFETIMHSWINSSAGPNAPMGFDMLVGRAPGGGPRFCTIAGRTVSITQPFVYATGGGYFFAPSMTAIRSLSRAGDTAP
jgi:Dyp-type peroxidase family